MRFSLFAVAAATAVMATAPDYEAPEAPQEYPEEVAPPAADSDYYGEVAPQETDCADGPEVTEVHTSTHTNYITVTKCAPGYADCPLLPQTSSALPVEETYAPEPEPIPSYEPEPIPEPVPEPEQETSSLPVPEETPYYPASNTTVWVGPTAHSSLVPVASEPIVPIEKPEPTDAPAPPAEQPPAEESQPAEAGAAGVVVRGGLMAGLFAVSMMVLC